MAYDYDLLVIGAGSGGLAASKRAASYGAKVAIIEGDLVGGTCVIRGCVPKKLLVYGSQFPHYFADAVGYGWAPVASTLDWAKLRDTVHQEVLRLNQVHIGLLAKNNVELLQGVGSFVDPHTVAVGDRKMTAAHILIAVGGEAVRLDRPGMEHTVTSREMFLLPEFPKRFVVIGAGYIGVEFAGIMHGLGAEVTQVIRRDLILRGFDQDMRTTIQEAMVTKGIRFCTNVDPDTLVVEKQDRELRLTFTNEAGESAEVLCDAILSATGRKPNLAGLMLEQAGVDTHRGAIAVTPDSCTSQPHIYAVGDCTDRVNLTPVAIAEGRAFADTVFGHQPRAISHRGIASAVFSQPEGATVGLTEEEARSQYGDRVKVYRSRFKPMFYSFSEAPERAMMKLVVEGDEERILGIHMVGKDAAEIIQGMAIALGMGATKKDFDRTIGIHPSSAEEFVTMR